MKLNTQIKPLSAISIGIVMAATMFGQPSVAAPKEKTILQATSSIERGRERERERDPATPLVATPQGQASLTVVCGTMTACNATNTPWSIDKTGVQDTTNNKVTWTITVSKGTVSDRILTFNGSLTVTNTGSAPATIGNIVVNLQRKIASTKFATVSSDVANATDGDAATTANICSGASSEGSSSFTENTGSSTLTFTDANNNNDIFSLVPQQTIAVGETKVLNYTAKFDATKLGDLPAAGESVRLEAIVSFGNAGARGSGNGAASCQNVDVSGNGVLSGDEANVRSVPCRSTLIVPVLEESNATVNLTDTQDNVTFSQDSTLTLASFSTDIGGGTGTELLSNSATRTVEVTLNPGGSGEITNCANLDASPIPACNAPVDFQACDTQTFALPLPNLSFCTFTQGGYQGGGNPGTIFANNFNPVFGGQNTSVPGTNGTGGLMIGLFGNNGPTEPNGSFWQANPTGQSRLATGRQPYLAGGGTSGALTNDSLNLKSDSSGTLGIQTATLTLNVNFSGRVTSPLTMPAGFGGLFYQNPQNPGDSLNGKTVEQILAVTNTVLAVNPLPAGYSYAKLNDLITNLNESFDPGLNGEQCPSTGTEWARGHLSLTPPLDSDGDNDGD